LSTVFSPKVFDNPLRHLYFAEKPSFLQVFPRHTSQTPGQPGGRGKSELHFMRIVRMRIRP